MILIQKLINIIDHINRKNKNYIIMSIGKVLDKIQYSFMIEIHKTL